MKLKKFIKEHQKEIIDEWVEHAQKNIEDVDRMKLEEVRDHIKQMLERITESMGTPQTEAEQEAKSKGKKEMKSGESKAARKHGSLRAKQAYDIVEVSSEFRALRASILRLWEEKGREENWETDFHDMVRFNEVIDELWVISLQRFHKRVDDSKNWFLGILGHDLRNPIAAVMGAQSILRLSENLSDKEKAILRRSDSSIKRMRELIDDLLQLTDLRLGSGITIHKSSVDLSKQAEKIVQELELAYPDAELCLNSPGPVEGEWDTVRLDQMMTNLVTNSLRHGKPGGPVKISVSAGNNEAFFEVHNEGTPMPKCIKEMISTGKFTKTEGDSTNSESYGLGLYIVNEIVNGHNGRIEVTSTEKAGTSFKVVLPRH